MEGVADHCRRSECAVTGYRDLSNSFLPGFGTLFSCSSQTRARAAMQESVSLDAKNIGGRLIHDKLMRIFSAEEVYFRACCIVLSAFSCVSGSS